MANNDQSTGQAVGTLGGAMVGGPMGATVGGAIGSTLGGLFGAGAASGDTNQANQAAAAAYQAILNAGAPPDLAKAILINQYKQAGTLTPAMEQSINAGPSQAAGISEDPQTRQAQMQALNLLSQRSTGGLNPEDMAKFNQLQQQTRSDEQAKQQQIMQNYQARGLGGGGAELAAMLSNQQGGANRESEGGMQLGALASQNALQAALQSGQLGGQIRGQDFSNNMQKAQAQDMMQRFNVQNQIATQQRNVAGQNNAQQQNLANAQNIGNANTSANNNELYRQNNAQQQQWMDAMQRAEALSNASLRQANYFQNKAQNTTNSSTLLGNGIGQLAGMGVSALSNSQQDPNTGGYTNGGGTSPGTAAGYGANTTDINPNAAVNQWQNT